MVIRKLFKYEMGHIVRNAWSERCSKSFHGHSYIVEFCFESRGLDQGGMVCDFGFLKQLVNPFVDSFDHASVIWDRKEDKHIIEFFRNNFDRVIVTPFTSTAEIQAAMFYYFGKDVLQYTLKNNLFVNGEDDVRMHSCRVHETTTGWAEFSKDSEKSMEGAPRRDDVSIANIDFSPGIQKDWPAVFKTFWSETR
jgi:6-pyruvoyltetrahydropterin/6-carboxytetrahydropterin synthase